jgi:glutathione S-transferase/RNA polymerase-associated protein
MIEEVMDTQYEATTWGMMEVRVFGRGGGPEGAAGAALLARATSQLAALHAWAEAHLGRADWFNGGTFGWGDIAVVPFVLGAVGFGAPPAPGSALAAWLDRCLARPSVAKTAAEAAAVAPLVAAVVPAMIASGQFKRQYRDHRLEWMLRAGGFDILVAGLADGSIRFSDEVGA